MPCETKPESLFYRPLPRTPETRPLPITCCSPITAASPKRQRKARLTSIGEKKNTPYLSQTHRHTVPIYGRLAIRLPPVPGPNHIACRSWYAAMPSAGSIVSSERKNAFVALS